MGYHGIILNAFKGTHSLPDKTVAQARADCVELIPTVSFLPQLDSNEMFQKTMRIKSLKLYEFLCAEASVHHSFVCALVMRSLERVMYTFMDWQKRDAHLLTNGDAPLIVMANEDRSPTVRCIQELSSIMTTGCVFPGGVTVAALVEGHLN